MEYRNSETKLDQLVSYLNEEKINLSPIFQRGRVWKLMMRQELIKNIVRRRPIPAIFLYKDEAGAKYSYNILDGKQRLESILMFIGSNNPHFRINTWGNYIFGDERRNVGFGVDLKDGKGKRKFADFSEADIRELREYPIPTIEITLSETTELDEIISLFVDINQYGERVSRLQIVRAIRNQDPLLESVYKLIAVRQRRRQDVYVKKIDNPFTFVLKRLQTVASVNDPASQADRMWEKLFELVLFIRSNGNHRKPTEILKTFIKSSTQETKMTGEEARKLRKVFAFVQRAYRLSGLGQSRLAMDQTHFYTMSTALLMTDMLDRFRDDDNALIERLVMFGNVLDGKIIVPKVNEALGNVMNKYREISARQTTDASRRQERQRYFVEAITLLTSGALIPHTPSAPLFDGAANV